MCEGPGPCIITPPDTHWMCGQCKYENEDASPICDACDFPRGADLSNADCFVKCPGAGCSQHVPISTSGCVERCLCQCGFLFCSLCLRRQSTACSAACAATMGIGLRFSCIHCPGGLELCVDCAVRPDVKHHGGGSAPHAFQMYNSDQNPPTKPQARCGICYDAKWSGRKVTFNYMNCAECRTQLADELLVDSMKEHLELKARVEKMCVEKCVEDEVMHGLEELFAADPKAACAAALDKLTVLQCSACSQPFCGGRIDCQEDDSLDITRIRCAPCAFEVQEQLAAAERKKALEAAADQEAIRQLTTGWKGACRKQEGFKSAIYTCDGCCAVAV